MVMDAPKNCRECPYTNHCPAPHYGAEGCHYERKAIHGTLTCEKREVVMR